MKNFQTKENAQDFSEREFTVLDDMVSVIMPSFNTASYIAQAIRTVQNQTYQNWELLIVDDCSSDDTDAVVATFLEDRRIRYMKNERNIGAAMSRNRALREARGRWIAFLDSDDLWRKNKLKRQIAFMKKNGYHFSYTKYGEIDEKSKRTGVIVSGPKHITKRKMYDYCWPGCLTVMYDSRVVGRLQVMDIKKNNDYAMWLKVVERADCYLLEECLALYRRGRAGSVSTQRYGELVKWHYRLFRKNGSNKVLAGIQVIRNLIFGALKKIVYKKKLFCT